MYYDSMEQILNNLIILESKMFFYILLSYTSLIHKVLTMTISFFILIASFTTSYHSSVGAIDYSKSHLAIHPHPHSLREFGSRRSPCRAIP